MCSDNIITQRCSCGKCRDSINFHCVSLPATSCFTCMIMFEMCCSYILRCSLAGTLHRRVSWQVTPQQQFQQPLSVSLLHHSVRCIKHICLPTREHQHHQHNMIEFREKNNRQTGARLINYTFRYTFSYLLNGCSTNENCFVVCVFVWFDWKGQIRKVYLAQQHQM